MVVPFAAGSSTDGLARVVANQLQAQQGWTIVVENMAGAQGRIGAASVKNAAPDGLRIGVHSTVGFAFDPFVDKEKAYKPGDFEYLGTIGTIEYALVAQSGAPYSDLKSLADWSKANRPIRFSGTGPSLELAMMKIAEHFGFKVVTAPTSGSGESMQLVLGGHADVTLSGGVHVPQIKAGNLKAIAMLQDRRADYAPDARTIREQGVNFSVLNNFMVFAPKGLPAAVKTKIVQALDQAINSDAVKDLAAKMGSVHGNLGAEGSTRTVEEQTKMWEALLAAK